MSAKIKLCWVARSIWRLQRMGLIKGGGGGGTYRRVDAELGCCRTIAMVNVPVVTLSIMRKFGQILGAIPSNPAWNSFLNSSARFLSGLR